MTKATPTRVEILKARVTYTETGFPASYSDVQELWGSRIQPAPEEAWWWIGATPLSARRIRRDGHKAVGTLLTTWIPPQTAGGVLPVDEPDGPWQPMYSPEGEDTMIGVNQELLTAERVTKVTWKDEDEVDGEPIGPVALIDGATYDAWLAENVEDGLLFPYGAKPVGVRELGWKTLREARQIAAEHGLELECL